MSTCCLVLAISKIKMRLFPENSKKSTFPCTCILVKKMASNIDFSGIPRGRCKNCDKCVCGYIVEMGNIRCSYCNCAPVLHEDISSILQDPRPSTSPPLATPKPLLDDACDPSNKISSTDDHLMDNLESSESDQIDNKQEKITINNYLTAYNRTASGSGTTRGKFFWRMYRSRTKSQYNSITTLLPNINFPFKI